MIVTLGLLDTLLCLFGYAFLMKLMQDCNIATSNCVISEHEYLSTAVYYTFSNLVDGE